MFSLCLCLWWEEVWEGASEGLFIPVFLICMESLKIESPRCCFCTCTRLSSNIPFLPKCSRRLSSVFWSMYCLSSPQPSRWKSSGYSGNPLDFSLLRRLPLLQTSGFYHALLTTSDEGYKSTLVTATGFHGLSMIVGFAFIIILFLIPTKLSLHFFMTILSLTVFRSIMDFPIYLHSSVRVFS